MRSITLKLAAFIGSMGLLRFAGSAEGLPLYYYKEDPQLVV